MPDGVRMPAVGDEIEVRKRHGGGYAATVTSIGRMAGVVDGRSVEHVFAVLSLGGPRLQAELHLDDDGHWFARERELQDMVAAVLSGGDE